MNLCYRDAVRILLNLTVGIGISQFRRFETFCIQMKMRMSVIAGR